ncbi:hypothetical protein B0T26DRAFT_866448 [Lasiosphaeria miniovina]|uniref:MACPF domain-containing protein n=1 Tax=Lasiosphaeria miniovina TaxID=1954250 RepID=A0AA40EF84_9PEZI|nr:uncharacterized protein B0T26DRAFT_866448 [Lasiosphaeria miniovina]KAK0733098.1 hypothetical protein B0T26DRAFT_866448 [Lasiosphaeria miniovina]
MSMASIKRPSLGQIADLGDFYDACTDSFTSISLLKGSPPPTTVRCTDNPGTETEVLKENSFGEKFRGLKVEADLGASILSGLISNTTVHEKLNLGAFLTPELRSLLNSDALRGNLGTHVVCEIEWGGSSAVIARCEIEDASDAEEVQAKLGAGLEELNKIVGAGAAAKGDFQARRRKRSTQANFGIKALEDHRAVAKAYEYCLPTDHLSEVSSRLCQAKARGASLRKDHEPSLEYIGSVVRQHRERMKFASTIVSKGAHYVGHNATELDTLIMGNGKSDRYVLYFNEQVQS